MIDLLCDTVIISHFNASPICVSSYFIVYTLRAARDDECADSFLDKRICGFLKHMKTLMQCH